MSYNPFTIGFLSDPTINFNTVSSNTNTITTLYEGLVTGTPKQTDFRNIYTSASVTTVMVTTGFVWNNLANASAVTSGISGTARYNIMFEGQMISTNGSRVMELRLLTNGADLIGDTKNLFITNSTASTNTNHFHWIRTGVTSGTVFQIQIQKYLTFAINVTTRLQSFRLNGIAD